MAQAQRRLAAINIDALLVKQDQLTHQVKAAETQLEAAKEALSSPEDSISATDTILEAASAAAVEVRKTGSSAEASGDLAGTAFTTLTLNIEVAGRLSDITNFIIDLSKRFPTGLVKMADVKSAAPPPPPADVTPDSQSEEQVPSSEQNGLATVSLVIYNYAGK